jgi:hypothetical protein
MSDEQNTKDSKPSLKDTVIRIQPISELTKSTDHKDENTTDGPAEIGGRKNGLDPTRYGDWEKNGRCIDF